MRRRIGLRSRRGRQPALGSPFLEPGSLLPYPRAKQRNRRLLRRRTLYKRPVFHRIVGGAHGLGSYHAHALPLGFVEYLLDERFQAFFAWRFEPFFVRLYLLMVIVYDHPLFLHFHKTHPMRVHVFPRPVSKQWSTGGQRQNFFEGNLYLRPFEYQNAICA